MGHFHIQRKRNRKNHKTIQGHANENSIQNEEHNRKHAKTTSAKGQIKQAWYIPNVIRRLSTKMYRTSKQNIPHWIQRKYTSN
jgi:hypothetical protein